MLSNSQKALLQKCFNSNGSYGIALNMDENSKEDFYFCREEIIAELYDFRAGETCYILSPTYRLYSGNISTKELNDAFFNINFQKFHKYMIKELFLPEQNMLNIESYNKPLPLKGTHSNIMIDHLEAATSNNLNYYILKPYNVPVDSWNLLVIRSYMLAAIELSIYPHNKDIFENKNINGKNILQYICENMPLYSDSRNAINNYKEHIYGKEKKYPEINEYNGILEFMEDIFTDDPSIFAS
jgi:hypothetical protein